MHGANAHHAQHAKLSLVKLTYAMGCHLQQKSVMRDLKIKLFGTLNYSLPNQPYVNNPILSHIKYKERKLSHIKREKLKS